MTSFPSVAAEKHNSIKQLKNYGVRGHTFTIKERSLLEVIQERLKAADNSGKIAQLQQQFQEKVKAKINSPAPVQGVKTATKAQTFYFDPSYIQTDDVVDHQKRVIVKAGTTVNPLNYLSWGEPLIFIDGDDVNQLAWAIKEKGKIILVKGSPITLQQQIKQIVYFDQAGILTRKFGITQVPARVSAENQRLRIDEIML